MNNSEYNYWSHKISQANIECETADMKQEVAIVSELGLQPQKDGDQFCFLWGKNLQEGIAGFGDTVRDAVLDFNKRYYKEKG